MSIFSAKALKGEHVLITGATGGIGRETALLLASIGADLTLTARNEQKLRQLQQKAQQRRLDGRIHIFPCDLREEQGREELVKSAETEIGPITGLVNNAGITRGDVVENLRREDIEKVMNLNFTAAVLLTQLVYQGMKKMKKGKVVNVSSLSGLRGTYGNSAYAGSKFALIGFTHSFAVEAARYGVRVNAVCPGFVNTEMGRNAIAKKGARSGLTYEEQRQKSEAAIPSGKITEPREVAYAIAFLLTGAVDNMIGESIKISGGSVL